VIGSGHEAAAAEVGRLLAERGCVVVTGGLAMRLGRPVVALEGAPEVAGVPRAATPAEAVELTLAAIPR
jgi:predicted Rossmann-fold nucleotide-binding protein